MYQEITVLKSAAGYYIGRLYADPDMNGMLVPGTRESEYYASREEAVEAIRNGFEMRDCEENYFVYAAAEIETYPGMFYQDKNYK